MSKITRNLGGIALAAVAIATAPVAAQPAYAQSAAVQPTETLTLSQGTGTLVRLPAAMSDVFIANDAIADVQVRSNRQLYVFGKGSGETTLYATGDNGRIVYAARVQVGRNVASVDEMLRLAMPEANIRATPMNNLMLLTGTVASPTDAEEAERLVSAYVGSEVEVVSRLRQATPLQVNLKVRIAEVNRSLVKSFGFNLFAQDGTNGAQFGFSQGTGLVASNPFSVQGTGAGATAGIAGKLFGLDLISTLDLAENDGLVTTLAEPNLTALSGETASFLAGGEFPIPISQDLGSISIEYKQYGVGLAFTPYVLADGRISMRVRPEVSELSNEGSIRLNGFEVPAFTTRRAETTVELGSGQSFMIAGLLRNSNTNSIEKAPFLGDIPILGALFRSNSYRKSETELVIIVTPYLVQPVSNRMALPNDGYRNPTDAQRNIEGRTFYGRSGVDHNAGDAVVAPRNVPGQPAISGPVASAAPQPGFGL
ncbi:type II and III secretion system protein family protein [Sphingomicrobium lutaoense]|uniref:Pilus assembly protein CpaC n=1 Tax=Sphingomicrobium lutaoense TaxID=515949 RepID=A0A839YXQ7_9SPHN|nr:type II and III secretion system protein family protein [Sphingomicrobium lutaoense]MBB3763959.1 pilus assembly protein CpaC [Sphingomicrobium lutaoense]